MDKQSIFKLLARQSDYVEIQGEKIEVKAMDLDGRFAFRETDKKSIGYRLAFVAAHSCPALHGCTPEEITENLSYEAISLIASKAMQLSGMDEGSEEEAGKNSESDQS